MNLWADILNYYWGWLLAASGALLLWLIKLGYGKVRKWKEHNDELKREEHEKSRQEFRKTIVEENKKMIDEIQKSTNKQIEEIQKSTNKQIEEAKRDSLKQIEAIRKNDEARDEKFSEQFTIIENELGTIKNGQKQLWHNAFFSQCEALLTPGKIISIDEFEICAKNHTEYNNLGGNGPGDELFERVQMKFDHQILNK